jgi:hypothetical protein
VTAGAANHVGRRIKVTFVSTESNEEPCRRFLEHVWNDGHAPDAVEFIHPDYDVPAVGRGPDAVKQNIAAFREAFPDLNRVIEDIVPEGDRVALRFTLHGTHLGVFRDIAPTGRRVTMQEMVFWPHLVRAWLSLVGRIAGRHRRDQTAAPTRTAGGGA